MSAFALAQGTLLAGHATDSFPLRQISNITQNINASLLEAVGSGAIDLAGAFQGDTPSTTTVTSTDSALLRLRSNLFLAQGACFDGSADPGVTNVMPFNKFVDCGAFDANATHQAIAGEKAFVVPTSISGQTSNAVEFNYDIHWLSVDSAPGANDGPFRSPFALLTNQALTAATLGESSQFYGASVNGAAIPRVNGFTLTPGLTVNRDPVNGGAFSTEAFITQRRMTLELTTDDLEGSLAFLNSQDLGTGLILYLARKQDSKQLRPTTDPVHASIAATAGISQLSTMTATTGQKGSGTIRITFTTPTGADPITVATNIVLP